VPLDYERWLLFGEPFVEAAIDSEAMILKYGKMRRTLGFKRLTVTDGEQTARRPGFKKCVQIGTLNLRWKGS
jgi:hypothetical protein